MLIFLIGVFVGILLEYNLVVICIVINVNFYGDFYFIVLDILLGLVLRFRVVGFLYSVLYDLFGKVEFFGE